jgi:hypothetical protein
MARVARLLSNDRCDRSGSCRSDTSSGVGCEVLGVGTLQQYAGRLRREHATKTDVRMIDFVGMGNPALMRRCGCGDKRQRSYGAIGRCVSGRWQSSVRNAAMRVSARKHAV